MAVACTPMLHVCTSEAVSFVVIQAARKDSILHVLPIRKSTTRIPSCGSDPVAPLKCCRRTCLKLDQQRTDTPFFGDTAVLVSTTYVSSHPAIERLP